jgi:hypothetical protein
MQNRNKGITLIALIITIIVMLILVGVVVTVVIQSNLLGTAKTAGDKYKTAYEDESNMSEVTINGEKYASIEDYINNNQMSSIKIKMEVTHEDTAVTADGTKVKSIEQGVPIPVGYSYVTGEKNTGVVIQDDTTSDQFVWVPVLQNQKIKIEIEAEEEITEIKIEDPLGTLITKNSENNDITVSGKTNTSIINPTTNGEYTVTVKTASDEASKTLYAKSLYAQDITSMRDLILAEIKKQAKEQNITEDEAAKAITGGQFNTVEELITTIKQMMQQYTDLDIATHKDGVNKYGGFYIARYEAGSENQRTSSSGTGDAVLSQANKYPYNYINQTESITKAATMNKGKTNVTASLINSAVWDRTLNWLEETNAVTRAELFDSTSWGNYSNSKFSFTGKYSTGNGANFTDAITSTEKPENRSYLLGTGVSDYTKKNNIYDLAGNCREWTTASLSSDTRALRGGYYLINGSGGPACDCLNNDPTDSYHYIGFRVSLYVNL